ncbi:MAG: ribosome small subunit-dependent GTPase A [Parachlamydiaceae bacterium]
MSEEHEHLYRESSKAGRQERKYLQAKDRSKYKKTDLAKWEAQRKKEHERGPESKELEKGRVLSISPQGYMVDKEGKLYCCTLRGLLKKAKGLDKNLVTTGDFVLFTPLNDKEGQIFQIEERKSVLARADNLSRKKMQLIAANIDQVLITLSVVNPPLKPFLADRYIIASEKGNMQPIILINKIDLLEKGSPEELLYQEFKKSYEANGIRVLPISAATGEGIEALKECMKDKASVFSGQSGAGKSSLINTITGLNLKVGDIVGKTKKGSHTTTSTQLVPLPFGGFCIDTPGIKSFGVWKLDRDEITSYFDEILEIGSGCRYPDCRHIEEGQCAVKEAVEQGKISPLRYESYVNLLLTIDEEHLRR